MGLVNDKNELIAPPLELTLRGTTMMVVMELADQMIKEGTLSAVRFQELTIEDFKSAKEVLVMGTTVEVLPVIEFEGQKIGDGTPGPVAKEILKLLREDMRTNSSRRLTV